MRDHFNRYGKGCDYWQVKEAYETFSGFLGDEPMCDSEEMEFKLLHTFYTQMKTPIIITINGVGINTDLTTLPHHLIHLHKWYVPLDKF